MKPIFIKELKEKRGIFIILLLLIFLCRILPSTLNRYIDEELLGNTMVFILPFLFSLFFGSLSFGEEFNQKTEEFILSKPIKTSSIFWIKFLSGILLTLFLTLITYLVFNNYLVSFTGEKFNKTHITNITFLPIFVYACTFFSSLLFKKVLLSIILSPIILIIFSLLFFSPLIGPLIIISPSSAIFSVISYSLFLSFFLIYSFFIWMEISKNKSPKKISFIIFISLLAFSYGIYGLTDLKLNSNLKKAIKSARENGIKIYPEEVIPPYIPHSTEKNAAITLNKSFEILEKLNKKYKEEFEYISDIEKMQKIGKKEKEKIGNIFETDEFKEFFSLILKAIDIGNCRFDIDYEKGPEILTPHLTNLREISKILNVRIYVLIQEGRYKEALELFKKVIKFGDCLENEPLLLSQQVRILIDITIIKNGLEKIVNSNFFLSNNDCEEIIAQLNSKNRSLKNAIEGKIAIFVYETFFGNPMYYIYPVQKMGISKISIFFYYNNYWKILLKYDYPFLLNKYQEILKIIEEPPYIAIEKCKSIDNEISKKITKNTIWSLKHFYSSLYLPLCDKIPATQASYEACLDCAKISLALRIYKNKYKKYPEDIQFLIPEILPSIPKDPFTGNNFIYKKKDNGFIIYSVGSNKKDDGGEKDWKTGKDDIAFDILK